MNRILCLLLCVGAMVVSPAFAEEAPLIRAQVGSSVIKNLVSGPDAVVMQDANGQDVIVVFYKRDKQQVGFVVGQTSLESGAIVWESDSYVLKSSVMKADEFAPSPVMVGNVLYLFGREHINNKGRNYIYNAFTSLQDLKALTDGTSQDRPYKQLGVQGQEQLGNIDAANQEGTLRLTFLQRTGQKHTNVPVSTSLCTADAQYVLSCKSAPASSDKFDDPVVQIPVTINGQSEWVMLVRDNDKRLVLSQWDSMKNAWNKLHTIDKFEVAGVPVGGLQIGGMLHLYFKEADASELKEASIFVSELLSTSGYWSAAVKKYSTDKSAMPLEYKGRAYVFYVTESTKECYDCTPSPTKLYYYSDKYID